LTGAAFFTAVFLTGAAFYTAAFFTAAFFTAAFLSGAAFFAAAFFRGTVLFVELAVAVDFFAGEGRPTTFRAAAPARLTRDRLPVVAMRGPLSGWKFS
jgi:hypothetical protein